MNTCAVAIPPRRNEALVSTSRNPSNWRRESKVRRVGFPQTSDLGGTLRKFYRLIAYAWPLPYTLLGITIGLISRARFQRVDGVVEIYGPPIRYLLERMPVPAIAMTFGHVVFGRDRPSLDVTRRHERVHVRQYERWGIGFVPAYLGISVVLYLRGRDGYRENPFEVEAFAVDRGRD